MAFLMSSSLYWGTLVVSQMPLLHKTCFHDCSSVCCLYCHRSSYCSVKHRFWSATWYSVAWMFDRPIACRPYFTILASPYTYSILTFLMPSCKCVVSFIFSPRVSPSGSVLGTKSFNLIFFSSAIYFLLTLWKFWKHIRDLGLRLRWNTWRVWDRNILSPFLVTFYRDGTLFFFLQVDLFFLSFSLA